MSCNNPDKSGDIIEDNPDMPCDGYILLGPMNETETYLINNDGEIVHTWDSGSTLRSAFYLLDNGNLLRSEEPPDKIPSFGGNAGRVAEYSWDGEMVWHFDYYGSNYLSHHDIKKMPDGNVLIVAHDIKSEAEALEAGCDPDLIVNGKVFADSVIEVDPSTNEIVWEWHLWDHLVQDYDPEKDNFGVVSESPELVDLNFTKTENGTGIFPETSHVNSIDYNEELDQIILSPSFFSEIWIIDHSTTSAEAAGHSGGRGGRGGDLVLRWGNPEAYGRGNSDDKKLFFQHSVSWIRKGLPGEDNILIFNNGDADRPYSSVVELKLEPDVTGNYPLLDNGIYAPEEFFWEYTAEIPEEFYARGQSGAQRQPNGNTLIYVTTNYGHLFEVKQDGEIIWEYDSWIRSFRGERYPLDYPGVLINQ